MTEPKQLATDKSFLSVQGYFFVIRKELIFQDHFESEFCNDKIAVTCLSDPEEAATFKRHLTNEGLSSGKDYVQGICSNHQVLDHSPNSWLEFSYIKGKWQVCCL